MQGCADSQHDLEADTACLAVTWAVQSLVEECPANQTALRQAGGLEMLVQVLQSALSTQAVRRAETRASWLV